MRAERDDAQHWQTAWVYPEASAAQRDLVLQQAPASSTDQARVVRTATYSLYLKTYAFEDVARLQYQTMHGKIRPCVVPFFPSPMTSPHPCHRVHLSCKPVAQKQDFYPDKYAALLDLLAEQYCTDADATAPLNLLLACAVRGRFKRQWVPATMPGLEAQPPSGLKELWGNCGMETILAYVAVLLQRRVAVIAESPSAVLSAVTAIAQLTPPTSRLADVYPNLPLEELSTLNTPSYIVGSTDAALAERESAYDVLVNMPAGVVQVAAPSESDFALGRLHRDIAEAVLEVAGKTEASDEDVAQVLKERTANVVDKLRDLADEHGKLSAETITGRKMAASTQRFLLNLAAAMNMLQE
ncbi:uncharacterized protein MONBRDRAFT_23538 [Monosiga brevicollis MX1]|uniref:UDENN domain-containing protein n=1 Tax=Monosiga brevicollis TaxID=81824 RepID=A9UTQ6_MONBE|nr:uncharacterized protein MONBRDRAFT_23538 [Monosiga brevicollis MX1]EDQ91291.1 predicted protein [Monosiga brevicollis MX1]|eukprot:XP_001743713.1 hypothetical protein [Monosiga brevicollis MX1]